MAIKNFYPEKPIVAFKKTTVEMPLVIRYIAAKKISAELKRAVYIFFRNESMNGQKGINNNYAGIQADSGRWQAEYDSMITGVVNLKENNTGDQRLFCAFKDFTATIDFLSGRLLARGLHVGGTTHKIVVMKVKDEHDLVRAYIKEWVSGDKVREPTHVEAVNFLSMYNQAKTFFP